jgi:hypothetical protein
MTRATIAYVQTVRLLHRKSYFGRPTGWNTVTFDYHGYEYRIRRPKSGNPPYRWTGECAVCSNPPTYRVYSVGATNRVRRIGMTTGGVIVALCVVAAVLPFLVSIPLSDTAFTVGAVAIMIALVVGINLLVVANAYFGFRGRGSVWPDHSKHRLILPGDPDFAPRR